MKEFLTHYGLIIVFCIVGLYFLYDRQKLVTGIVIRKLPNNVVSIKTPDGKTIHKVYVPPLVEIKIGDQVTAASMSISQAYSRQSCDYQVTAVTHCSKRSASLVPEER